MKSRLVEAALGLGVRRHRLGHEGLDAGIVAGLDLRAAEVAAVGEGLQLALAHRLACGHRHRAQLRAVAADVGDLVRNDEVVLGVDRRLHVVAHDARSLGPVAHRSCVGIGQRELPVGLVLQAFLHLVHPAHLLAQGLELVLQCLDRGPSSSSGMRAVGGVRAPQVALDAFLDLLLALLDLGGVKLRSRLLTALNLLPSMATAACENSLSSRHSTTKRLHTLRMPAPLSRRKSAMVLKSGARRPVNHISSTLRWHSRSSRRLRLHAVQVAVDVDLQQHRRVVRRAARVAPASRPSKPSTPDPIRPQTRRRPEPGCPRR